MKRHRSRHPGMDCRESGHKDVIDFRHPRLLEPGNPNRGNGNNYRKLRHLTIGGIVLRVIPPTKGGSIAGMARSYSIRLTIKHWKAPSPSILIQ
ncbi:MAG: hypothetical protein Q7U98_02205 [Methylicorpusculum sp.]|uniref:hypothetical protein n=1 Tax=Methylicorpusculum sp. TaxID=2713644 RepID=UPI002717230C|nr:hypothetical protein [Methylicorpusculum sp.]MDO8937950.1 hypothetical protein [Methylicorpusculum sp.]MDP2203934.1 hypothetical protein [Methylicorpusculum sp.]